jgi:NifU-like protein involved in Fe-S cluster formation
VDFFEEFRLLSDERRFENSGSIANPVTLSNPVCGDVVTVGLTLEQSRVKTFEYRARGCWPVFGCLELLGKRWLGQTSERILTFSVEEFLGLVDGVPASKRHAFSLTHRGLLRAVTEAMIVGAAERESVGHSAQERL